MNKRHTPLLFSVMLFVGCVWPHHSAWAQGFREKSERDEDDVAWVKDLEPGIRLYGKVPEFAEVGQSHLFDVSPDGQTIAFAVGTGIKFWNIEDRTVEHELELKFAANTMEYSPAGRTILATVWAVEEGGGAPKQSIIVVDAIAGEKRSEFSPTVVEEAPQSEGDETKPARAKYIQHFAISPDGDLIALGFGKTTQIHEISTGEMISDIVHSRSVNSMAFSGDSKQLYDGQGKVFDTTWGAEIEKMPPVFARKHLTSIRIHPKQEIIAATAWNTGIIVWDFAKNERIKLEQPKENAKSLYQVEFSNNGRYVASASYAPSGNSKLFVWELDSGKLINNFKLRGNSMVRMRFSADSSAIYTKTSGEYGVSRMELDSKPATEMEQLTGNTGPISQFRFSDDKQRIVAASNQGESVVYDLQTGEPLINLQPQHNVHLDATEDCRFILLGGLSGNLVIYNCEDKKSQAVNVRTFSRASPIARLGSLLTGESQDNYEYYATNSVAIADGNEHFLVACRGRDNFRWEKFQLNSGKSVDQKRFKMKDFWDADVGQPDVQYWQERSIAIAPNGQWLAIIHGRNVYVVDAESGVLLHRLEDSAKQNSRIYFTPDSARMLVTTGNSVRLWDIDSGEEIESDFKTSSNIQQIAISQNGKRLAVLGNGSAKLRVFDLEDQGEVYSRELKEHRIAVGISHDGNLIALAKPNCQFEVLDLEKVDDR